MEGPHISTIVPKSFFSFSSVQRGVKLMPSLPYPCLFLLCVDNFLSASSFVEQKVAMGFSQLPYGWSCNT